MITKYRLCRIGASLGAAVGIISGIYLIVVYGATIFGKLWEFAGMMVPDAAVGVGILAFLLVLAGYAAVRWDDWFPCGEMIIVILAACGYLILVGCAIFQTLPNSNHPLPAGSHIAVIPSIVILLFLLFYHSEMFKFCNRFKK